MKKTARYRRLVPALIFASLLVGGPLATPPAVAAAEPAAATVKAEANVIIGKVLGLSKKAKTITVETDDKKTEMIKFDDGTKGVEHAKVNEGSVISVVERDGDKIATEIKPRLVKLPAGVTEATIDELAKLIAQGPEAGNYFLVDSRPAKRWHEGHIPTAVSIPVDKLEEAGAAALPADAQMKNTMLIFYCGGPTCGLSTKSASLARKMGYTNVKAALQGEPGWVKAGRPLVASDNFVKTGNIVLIDLRSPDEATKGHIKGAVNIPMAKLADAEDAFPAKKSAPIVVYGNGNDAETAAKTITAWGYKNVAIVDGGISRFRERGTQLATGPAASEIKWVRKLGEGEVALAEFMKAAEGAPGQIILDVRSKEEVGNGMFKNAIHMPLDEIGKRAAELPRDKELLAHCTTGARAQMAMAALKKAGLQARFLVADVECEKGTCQAAD